MMVGIFDDVSKWKKTLIPLTVPLETLLSNFFPLISSTILAGRNHLLQIGQEQIDLFLALHN